MAILARGATPVVTRRALPGDPADEQARYIEAAVNGVLIASIYLPNGNPQPGPEVRLQAGLVRAADRPRRRRSGGGRAGRARRRLQCRADRGRHLAGPPRAGQRPAAAREPARPSSGLLDQGWTDALRDPAARGAALDLLGLPATPLAERQGHAPGSPAAQPRPAERAARRRRYRGTCGEEGASDHAPTWIEIKQGVRRIQRPPPRPAGGRRASRSTARR